MVMTDDSLLESALWYARHGWPVFPCRPDAKTPATAHGLHNATTDEATIRAWWQRSPNANIGINCGASGLVVVDLDVKNGAKGLDTWATLHTELGIDDHTPTVATPTKGLHLYYAASGQQVRNSAGKLGQGVDVRAAGGYVVAPPSRTPDGEYGWELDLRPMDCALLPLPERLAEALAEAKGETPTGAAMGAAMPQGERNSTLTSMAGAMRRKGFEVAAITAALLETNAARCKPPLAEAEVRQIAASIGRYEPADETTREGENDDEHRTDLGNARRLVALHGQDLLYCSALGGWLVWDGRRWALDETGQVVRFAKDTVDSMYDEAMLEKEQTARETLMKHAMKSENAARIRAMVDLAQTEPSISVTPDVFDADPWLLNVANGTLDLRTGQLREHERGDMLTKLAPVDYAPNAYDVTLDRYLATVTDGDSDFAAYLQRAAGYSLTGDTGEECFFLVLGPAATGKSTLVEALLAMLGDYGLKSSFSAFLESRYQGGATPEIARLRGARLVAAVESPRDGRLNEVAIKELTGGDTVTARNLYAAPFSFKPRFKLWLAANDCPRMTDTDTGLWRRLQRLPFEHELPEGKRDPKVKQQLCNEALPALLAWAVRGCLAWQRDGLQPPAVVRTKTAELRADFDPLAEFLAECCVFANEAETPALELRQAYEAWAASMGARPINNRDWSQRLKARGCESIRTRRDGNPVTMWQDVGLLAEPLSDQREPAGERGPACVQDVHNKRHSAQTTSGKLL